MRKPLFTLVICCTFFFFGIETGIAQEESTEKLNNTLKQPLYLQKGDTVAIVAPAGILKNREGEINKAKALLKNWGLQVVVGNNIFNQGQHFAGTDDERCEDFQKALDNPNVKAIWCARGGYGSVRILDKLDWTTFKKQPKWIIGYSDITAIHNEVHNLGFQSIHAMMCTSLQDDAETITETISTFKDAIFGKQLSYTLEGSRYNKPGSASAPLVGGNLTIMHTMLGSRTSIDPSGKILFIEEIGEYKYHIDRMLHSLKRAGYFDDCKGVIIGNMTKIKRNTTPWGSSIQQLILDVLADYNFPIAFNMKAGHEKDNRALILGEIVDLQVKKEQSTLKFTP
ncbi:muramoyltetrapeptide carboxypeptidase [Hyunsoonleella jejuensis]|uniref:Muramoyltetrapeptide carboxypeptidase n=1 Tax=Hyunsoonleella jejuensis TaxID=419940 RepID=A0A1H9AVH0_9FLAO|nr:LD-carboxypeptidase [Hyunsoonleella jejuensis]SEP79938.1 muramoyltetrapeptide carboxypeptidase [Hyunsoonleella jejuensis]